MLSKCCLAKAMKGLLGHLVASLVLTGWAIMYVSVGDGEKGKKVAILQTIFMAISHKL